MADRNKIICGVGCGVCVLITTLIFVLCSIGTVEPIEYGIKYNAITKTIDDSQVYTGGWYFIGIFNTFETFPSTLVNMDFADYPDARSGPLSVKDSDGQEISLSFSIQYKLKQDEIAALYNKYQKSYEARFVSYVDSTIRKIIGDFNSTKFWAERAAAGEDLRAQIDQRLTTEHARCEALQLITVRLSKKRENSLIQTQVTTQHAKTLAQNQEAEKIRKETDTLESETDKTIVEIQGNARAQAKNINAKWNAEATKVTIDATSNAYNQVRTSLNMEPKDGLHKFIYYTQLQQSKDVDMYFGIKKALISLKS